MAITKEDVLKLAALSKLSIQDDELDNVAAELQAVLNYAETVCEFKPTEQLNVSTTKNVNVMRDDAVLPTNSAPIVAQAPDQEDNYFVVPKVLD